MTMDSEDVNRILDNLNTQGNGADISLWVFDHMCSVCEYRLKELKENESSKRI